MMNWELLITIIGSGSGGALLLKLTEIYFLPKKEKKEFDEKVRDELWDRIKNLEGRIDEQNKMIVEVMKENAALKAEVEMRRFENDKLKINV
jgi:predicted nuclease with TOPRIM domain